ncbi:nicotinamidase-like amidase [Candidatus Kinetoplastibacterium desouzaii TCC079E]|uniref:Nicotinamidase-like amidase n=1 Tax=Candidatus Kinetoplastidibacterium desouzai TCC079E TaxID=1208919 RepID=M1LQX3_9PROT|nr:nicotinamidase-like amidase [Candidatus Kinetoplastibacterium desouzaii]AGF46566.1 nicotinamidase-like amidase [Candidatus Kinetoplastibacterium desouzaii TCC079E]
MNINLLIIDPQNDFCDLSTINNNSIKEYPALPIKGADNDMQRLSAFIDKNIKHISNIAITLDTHHIIDISLISFWETYDGKELKPFTLINSESIKKNKIIPKNHNFKQYAFNYIKNIEVLYKQGLIVWPIHCQIGSWGHNIHKDISKSCLKWEKTHIKNVEFFLKGLNPLTEQYSAVELTNNKNQIIKNNKILSFIKNSDKLIIAGEASSHCVKKTIEDLIKYLQPNDLKKIIVLSDCMSPVYGFADNTNNFFLCIEKEGIQISQSNKNILCK